MIWFSDEKLLYIGQSREGLSEEVTFGREGPEAIAKQRPLKKTLDKDNSQCKIPKTNNLSMFQEQVYSQCGWRVVGGVEWWGWRISWGPNHVGPCTPWQGL